MEPLTTALIAAISAAAGSIAGGIAEAVGDDAWAATKRKLATWAGLSETQARQQALERAARQARKVLTDSWQDQEQLRLTFEVLELGVPEARQFTQAMIEELLLSDTPNIGRLLDLYRNKLRFTSALRNIALPEWELIEPVLNTYFGEALPQALRKQKTLRPLLLEQAQLQMLDEFRSMRALAQEQTEILRRNEALLREMLLQPRLQATIIAGDGSTISHSPVNLLLGSYQQLTHHSQADLEALYRRFREFLRSEYELLDFRGILPMQNVVKLRLEEIYVPLYGSETKTKRGGDLQGSERLEQGQAAHPGAKSSQSTTPSLHDLIRDTSRLVILGAPGSGKSTLVKYVLLSLIRGQGRERLGLYSDWLPILFPVAEFARAREQQAHLAPLAFVSNYYVGKSQPDFGDLFTRALLSGQALVLFDGLDEVRDSADRLEIVRCCQSSPYTAQQAAAILHNRRQ